MAQQLIASTTSQALELAQAGAVMIFNHGPSAAHVVSGEDNTVVATAATGSMIARGVAVRVGAAGGFIAAICDAGTATLDISPVAAASDWIGRFSASQWRHAQRQYRDGVQFDHRPCRPGRRAGRRHQGLYRHRTRALAGADHQSRATRGLSTVSLRSGYKKSPAGGDCRRGEVINHTIAFYQSGEALSARGRSTRRHAPWCAADLLASTTTSTSSIRWRAKRLDDRGRKNPEDENARSS